MNRGRRNQPKWRRRRTKLRSVPGSGKAGARTALHARAIQHHDGANSDHRAPRDTNAPQAGHDHAVDPPAALSQAAGNEVSQNGRAQTDPKHDDAETQEHQSGGRGLWVISGALWGGDDSRRDYPADADEDKGKKGDETAHTRHDIEAQLQQTQVFVVAINELAHIRSASPSRLYLPHLTSAAAAHSTHGLTMETKSSRAAE